MRNKILSVIFKEENKFNDIQVQTNEELFKKDNDPPLPSPPTLKSDMKILEGGFEVIHESAEGKEDSNTEQNGEEDIQEKKGESFQSSEHTPFESSESEISDEEAASIIEKSTISKATMKRLTLVRKPTLEEDSLQSPTKLGTRMSPLKTQVQFKEEIFKENIKRDEEMQKKMKDFINLTK